jgi:hypothetical protein
VRFRVYGSWFTVFGATLCVVRHSGPEFESSIGKFDDLVKSCKMPHPGTVNANNFPVISIGSSLAGLRFSTE